VDHERRQEEPRAEGHGLRGDARERAERDAPAQLVVRRR